MVAAVARSISSYIFVNKGKTQANDVFHLSRTELSNVKSLRTICNKHSNATRANFVCASYRCTIINNPSFFGLITVVAVDVVDVVDAVGVSDKTAASPEVTLMSFNSNECSD